MNPYTCENSRYLKNFDDDSVIVCEKIINVTESVSKMLRVLYQKILMKK